MGGGRRLVADAGIIAAMPQAAAGAGPSRPMASTIATSEALSSPSLISTLSHSPTSASASRSADQRQGLPFLRARRATRPRDRAREQQDLGGQKRRLVSLAGGHRGPCRHLTADRREYLRGRPPVCIVLPGRSVVRTGHSSLAARAARGAASGGTDSHVDGPRGWRRIRCIARARDGLRARPAQRHAEQRNRGRRALPGRRPGTRHAASSARPAPRPAAGRSPGTGRRAIRPRPSAGRAAAAGEALHEADQRRPPRTPLPMPADERGDASRAPATARPRSPCRRGRSRTRRRSASRPAAVGRCARTRRCRAPRPLPMRRRAGRSRDRRHCRVAFA